MIPISQLVRMTRGTTETYLLAPGDESYFLKKLSTYATRAKAKVEHVTWICIHSKDDSVRRMVVCKVIRPGKKLQRKRRT